MLAKLTIKDGQPSAGAYFLDVMAAAQLLAQLAEQGANFIPLNGLIRYEDDDVSTYKRIAVGKDVDFSIELAENNEVPGYKEQ